MNKYYLIIWILMSIIIEAVFISVRFKYRVLMERKTILITTLIELILFILIAFATIAMNNIFTVEITYLFGGMYIVILSDTITNIIMMIVSFFDKNISIFTYGILASVVMIIIFTYGTINSQVIKPNYLTFNSQKIKNNHTFVFMSDMHYPTAQFKSSVKKALNDIKMLNPEFILLGGDITDDLTKYEEIKEIYENIAELNIPTYFIYGNHDRQNDAYRIGRQKISVDELEKIIKENGITILKDEWQYATEDIIELGADLQLSGHTHAGQLFPLKTVYKLGVEYVFGKYKITDSPSDKYLYVSSGFSGWVLPFRNEEHCNYEVISLIVN